MLGGAALQLVSHAHMEHGVGRVGQAIDEAVMQREALRQMLPSSA